MRRLALGAALAAVLLAVPVAHATYPVTQDPCPGVTATVSVFKQLGTDVLENLGFDLDGHIWISDSTQAKVLEFDAWGVPLKSVAVPGPGAINRGSSGFLYVNTGGGIAGALQHSHQAGVVRFDPGALTPTPTPVATGLNMANGGTFDADGNLYASNDVDKELTRITPGGSPSLFSDVYGTNGLVVVGGNLYAAITFDQRSPIERIPLANPAAHSTFVELSVGALSLEPGVRAPQSTSGPLVGVKGLDDMTTDGQYLYVVANGMGELLRVDLATRAACLLASGLQNPSSVRFERGFDGSGNLFITEFSGAIRRVHVRPTP